MSGVVQSEGAPILKEADWVTETLAAEESLPLALECSESRLITEGTEQLISIYGGRRDSRDPKINFVYANGKQGAIQ